MRSSSPKNLAFITSAYITLLFSAFYLLIGGVFFHIHILKLLPLSLILFVSSYLIVRYVLERFIYEKIRLIYKSIHHLKVKKTPESKKFNSKTDIIENVNREVQQWGETHRLEIEELKNSAAYRREFLGNVSHELKTPIFNIQGYVLTLLDGGLDDPEINREYLLRTEKSINRMITIVEDLEAISQLESGELQLKKSNFDIVLLTKEVVDMLEMKAKEKNVSIFFRMNDEKPVFVDADKEKIRQVFTNLVDNSLKYSKNKDAYIKISFFDMDENVLIEVTDNGIGIEQKDIPRIFERFYRTDKSRSREQGGTGLGLAIVKHILEAHNQTIHVRSTIRIGTTFGFTLSKATNKT